MYGWIGCQSLSLVVGSMMALEEFFERILVGISCRVFKYVEYVDVSFLVQLVWKFIAVDTFTIGKALFDGQVVDVLCIGGHGIGLVMVIMTSGGMPTGDAHSLSTG